MGVTLKMLFVLMTSVFMVLTVGCASQMSPDKAAQSSRTDWRWADDSLTISKLRSYRVGTTTYRQFMTELGYLGSQDYISRNRGIIGILTTSVTTLFPDKGTTLTNAMQLLYSGQGVSGASLKAKRQLMRLLDVATPEEAAFDQVSVDDTSRLSRDKTDPAWEEVLSNFPQWVRNQYSPGDRIDRATVILGYLKTKGDRVAYNVEPECFEVVCILKFKEGILEAGTVGNRVIGGKTKP